MKIHIANCLSKELAKLKFPVKQSRAFTRRYFKHFVYLNILYMYLAYKHECYVVPNPKLNLQLTLLTPLIEEKEFKNFLRKNFNNLTITVHSDECVPENCYHPATHTIKVNFSTLFNAGVLVHELRHHIQNKLGLLKEINPDYFANPFEIDAMATAIRFYKWLGYTKEQIISQEMLNTGYTRKSNSTQYK